MNTWEKIIICLVWLAVAILMLMASEILLSCKSLSPKIPRKPDHWELCVKFCGSAEQVWSAHINGKGLVCRCQDTRINIFYKEDL